MVFGIFKLQNLHSLAKGDFLIFGGKLCLDELLNFYQFCDCKIPSYTECLESWDSNDYFCPFLIVITDIIKNIKSLYVLGDLSQN